MKISITFLLFSVLGLQLLMANNGYGQSLKDEIVTLEVRSKYLPQVLKEIEKQTGYRFAYNSDQIAGYLVDLEWGKRNLEETLNMILAGKPLQYNVVKDKFIVMSVVPHNRDVSIVTPLSNHKNNSHILRIIPLNVEGQVTDQKGEPLIGVNIQVKGTNKGTSTDFDGNFSFDDLDENAVLVVSYIGYQTMELSVAGKSNLIIKMDSDSQLLDEVVVVGYGSQRRSDITGAQSGISEEDFENQPVDMALGAMEGKIAGVNIQRTSGQPGGGFMIRVRGGNSINGSNDPLYVVDGLQMEGVADIDPNSIKSIEVLKDAVATSLYGARGANGVVVITTKSGKLGEPSLNFKSSVGFQYPSKIMPIMTAAEFAEIINEQRTVVGGNAPFTESQISELRRTGGTDYQELMLQRGAPLQQYNLSANGGSEYVNYYISGGIVDQKSLIYNSKYRRYIISSKLNINVSDQLKIGLNIDGIRTENNGVAGNIFEAMTFDPTTPPVNEDGTTNLSSTYGTLQRNPYLVGRDRISTSFDNKIRSSANLTYYLTDWLSLDFFGGVTASNGDYNSYTPIYFNTRGQGTTSTISPITLQNTNKLSVNKRFNSNNHLMADLIVEQYFSENRGKSLSGSDFVSDATTYKDLKSAETISINNYITSAKLLSYLGRFNYVWKDKYIMGVSARYDGSSRFQEGNRFGFFPSVSLAWKLENEKFFENFDNLDQLKLRSSYGSTGSQAVSVLSTVARLTASSKYPINDDSNLNLGIGPTSTLNNPNLTWETTDQFNIGLDISLFLSRLTLNFDFYNKTTKNLLLDVLLPSYTGKSSKIDNLGEMGNRGFEFSIGGLPIQKRDLSVEMNLNFDINKNQILSLGGDQEILSSYSPSEVGGIRPILLKVGSPYPLFRGYTFDGVYQENQSEEAAQYGRNPGDAILRDINGDGNIDDQDIGVIGNPHPDLRIGFFTTLNYKNFDLNIVTKGSIGGEIYNLGRGSLFGNTGGTRDAVTAEILDRWTPDNPSNTIPGITPTTYSPLVSSQFLEDGSYFKIKNVALGYNFSFNNLKKSFVSSIRVYSSMENILTFTKFTGYDPELSVGNDATYGVYMYYGEAALYPIAKIATFGVEVKFK